MADSGGEMVGQVGVPDGDGDELGTGTRGHLLGDATLVVVGLVEREREGADGPCGVAGGKAQHRR